MPAPPTRTDGSRFNRIRRSSSLLPPRAVGKYCDEYVCLRACLYVCPRRYLRNLTRDLYQFFSRRPMLHISVARSSSEMFTIGRIAYRQEGVFFPIENTLSAGNGNENAQRRRSMLSTIALLLLFISISLCLRNIRKVGAL